VFTKGNEQAVDLDPVASWELGFERDGGFLGGGRLDVTPTVRDAVDVDVDGDPWLAARDPEHQVRTLGADTREGPQNPLVTG
jgi:hypothetical protein